MWPRETNTRGHLRGKPSVPRPVDLPEYARPPLTEVAISVQFDALANYKSVLAGPIWELYKDRFPVVRELIPLPPVFETFGPRQALSFNFNVLDAPIVARLWFLNANETELLQFQPDRFGRNWRKIPPLDNTYPRFESMIEDFRSDFARLSAFTEAAGLGAIRPNQCELTYVNFVPELTLDGGELSGTNVLKSLQFDSIFSPTDINVSFATDLRDLNGAPYGRVHVQASTMVTPEGVRGLNLTLTTRGHPLDRTMASALDRLVEFREQIVRTFDSTTSASAHRAWGRVEIT
jgi:uncharacterized protein (TIGR04255 family)